jgi:hypothetical protein
LQLLLLWLLLLLLLCSYLRDILQVVVYQVLLRFKCNLDSLQDTRSAQEHETTLQLDGTRRWQTSACNRACTHNMYPAFACLCWAPHTQLLY